MLSVLVIDDQPLVRDVVCSMLGARGISARASGDGPSGLSVFAEAQECRAVLIDVDMPGMNGIEVCRELRRLAEVQQRACRLWLMTGVARPGLEHAAQAAGATDVLLKPFTTTELVRALGYLPEGDSASLANADRK